MNDIGINQVLAQMRSMRLQAQAGAGSAQPTLGAAANAKVGGDAFTGMLKKSIDAVNTQQQQATQLAEAFERGDKQADLAQVMIQMQKSNLSFQAMTQVRNKLVQAYQEIMSMPI
jgi:flagellar hook-basal body complex protein FliE